MYSPTLGRFMQPDPIGYADGLNMYRYVQNDPVNAVDPTGLSCLIIHDTSSGTVRVCGDDGGDYDGGFGGGGGSGGGDFDTDDDADEDNNERDDAGDEESDDRPCPTGSGLKLDAGVGATGFFGVVGASLGVSGGINIPTKANGRPSLRGSQLSISGSITPLAGLGLFAGAGPNFGTSGSDGPANILSGSSDTVLQGGAGDGLGVELVRPLNDKPADWSGSGGRFAAGVYGAIGQRFSGTLSTPQLGCQ